MKTNRFFAFAYAEIILASISFIDVINEYMRIVAAIAATVTLVFAVIKFLRDEGERKQRSKLTDLQIENELRERDRLMTIKRDEQSKF